MDVFRADRYPSEAMTTDAEAALAQVLMVARLLEPKLPEVKRKHALIVRAGLRADSMPDGPGGGEKPLPITQRVRARDADGYPIEWWPVSRADSTDQEANDLAKQIARRFVEAARLMEKVASVLRQADIDASWFLKKSEVVPDDPEYDCANPLCTNKTPRGKPDKPALCDRCRKWRSDKGADYPYVRETA